MSKYIIEIAEEYEEYFKGVLICGIADGKFAVDVIAREDLEELNSDYINEHFGELQDEAYQRGLEDAWEAARKIVVDPDNGGIASGTLLEIFGMRGYSYIMQENTAQQAIDKIKAYEDNDRIEVGDEVIWTTDNITLIVTSIYKVGSIWCDGVAKDGKVHRTLIENLTKTGKHFDIQSILEAMRK